MKKIISLTLMSIPFFVSAQGFQVNLQGQKQQAMGAAGVALIQDGTSVFYNPGGVSFLKENSVSVGMSAVISKIKFQDAVSSKVSRTESPVSPPFTAYGVWGKPNSKFKFGIASYVPFGSTVVWEEGWTGRFALTRLALQSVFIQPTVSYKINDQWGIGAGFIYGTGKVGLKRDIPLADVNSKYANAELDGAAKGVGFNAGVYYKPSKKLSLGLSYRSQVNMKVDDGTATFTVPSALKSSFPSGPFTASIKLPSTLMLGAAYAATPKLTLVAEANYVGWKSYDTLAFDYAKNTAILGDTKSPRNYKNTFAFRLGGQYQVCENLIGRAGLIYALTPVLDGYVTPESPDADYLNFCTGLGYKINNKFTVDASFMFAKKERTDTNKETMLSGTYKTYLFIPGASLTYNF